MAVPLLSDILSAAREPALPSRSCTRCSSAKPAAELLRSASAEEWVWLSQLKMQVQQRSLGLFMRSKPLLLVIALASTAFAQHAGHDVKIGWVPQSILKKPTTLKEGTGKIHDPVTTASPEAQAFYEQGLAYLHSYVWIEAARSFNQALRVDPKMSMAYVGLSRVYSNLNDESSAQTAVAEARELASAVSGKDR